MNVISLVGLAISIVLAIGLMLVGVDKASSVVIALLTTVASLVLDLTIRLSKTEDRLMIAARLSRDIVKDEDLFAAITSIAADFHSTMTCPSGLPPAIVVEGTTSPRDPVPAGGRTLPLPPRLGAGNMDVTRVSGPCLPRRQRPVEPGRAARCGRRRGASAGRVAPTRPAAGTRRRRSERWVPSRPARPG